MPIRPGHQSATFIRDSHGRLVIWRSALSAYCHGLLRPIHEAVCKFMASVALSGAWTSVGHSRGNHFSCNLGYHRESREVRNPRLSTLAPLTLPCRGPVCLPGISSTRRPWRSSFIRMALSLSSRKLGRLQHLPKLTLPTSPGNGVARH